MALVIPVTTQEKINTMARKLHSAGIVGICEVSHGTQTC